MGIVTLHLRDDVEKLLRELAKRRGKKKGAMSKVVEEALLNLYVNDEFDKLLNELRRGIKVGVKKLKREDIYEI